MDRVELSGRRRAKLRRDFVMWLVDPRSRVASPGAKDLSRSQVERLILATHRAGRRAQGAGSGTVRPSAKCIRIRRMRAAPRPSSMFCISPTACHGAKSAALPDSTTSIPASPTTILPCRDRYSLPSMNCECTQLLLRARCFRSYGISPHPSRTARRRRDVSHLPMRAQRRRRAAERLRSAATKGACRSPEAPVARSALLARRALPVGSAATAGPG